jgi:hypothetical protein
MTKNQFVAEKLRLCWCDWSDKYHSAKCIKCGVSKSDSTKRSHPDFSTDAGAVQLLRLMRSREEWEDFKFEIAVKKHNQESLNSAINNVVDCITTPGALLDAVYEFLGGKEANADDEKGQPHFCKLAAEWWEVNIKG